MENSQWTRWWTVAKNQKDGGWRFSHLYPISRHFIRSLPLHAITPQCNTSSTPICPMLKWLHPYFLHDEQQLHCLPKERPRRRNWKLKTKAATQAKNDLRPSVHDAAQVTHAQPSTRYERMRVVQLSYRDVLADHHGWKRGLLPSGHFLYPS